MRIRKKKNFCFPSLTSQLISIPAGKACTLPFMFVCFYRPPLPARAEGEGNIYLIKILSVVDGVLSQDYWGIAWRHFACAEH